MGLDDKGSGDQVRRILRRDYEFFAGRADLIYLHFQVSGVGHEAKEGRGGRSATADERSGIVDRNPRLIEEGNCPRRTRLMLHANTISIINARTTLQGHK